MYPFKDKRETDMFKFFFLLLREFKKKQLNSRFVLVSPLSLMEFFWIFMYLFVKILNKLNSLKRPISLIIVSNLNEKNPLVGCHSIHCKYQMGINISCKMLKTMFF